MASAVAEASIALLAFLKHSTKAVDVINQQNKTCSSLFFF